MNLQTWYNEMLLEARSKGMNDAAIARGAGMSHSGFVQLTDRIMDGKNVFVSTCERVEKAIREYE